MVKDDSLHQMRIITILGYNKPSVFELGSRFDVFSFDCKGIYLRTTSGIQTGCFYSNFLIFILNVHQHTNNQRKTSLFRPEECGETHRHSGIRLCYIRNRNCLTGEDTVRQFVILYI